MLPSPGYISRPACHGRRLLRLLSPSPPPLASSPPRKRVSRTTRRRNVLPDLRRGAAPCALVPSPQRRRRLRPSRQLRHRPLVATSSAAAVALLLCYSAAATGDSASGLGVNLGSMSTTITDMLSREPSRRQCSIKHSATAPRSHARCGGGGCCPGCILSSGSADGSGGGGGGRPLMSISRTCRHQRRAQEISGGQSARGRPPS